MKHYVPKENWYDNLDYAKSELSLVSPTFCLAKWLQSTIHFHLGKTHSCHHPPLTDINIKKIQSNPSALHNSDEKIQQRDMLLRGKKPSGCDYCWKIEDIKKNLNSDRITKSSTKWATPHFYDVIDSGLGENINPTYLEVSFSNECQFKCAYCSADFSSKWQEEINQFGTYKTGNGFSYNKLEKEDSNVYIKAFWIWWPNLVRTLKVFRITGGEPLLSKNTFLVLDKIFENTYPDLELAINSNLGPHENVVKNFISKIKLILEQKKIKTFTLFTSIDTFGDHAEYIRHGLNFKKFEANVLTYLSEVPNGKLTFMVTYNIFSTFKFLDLLKWIVEIKKKHHFKDYTARIGLDINFLRNPEFMSAQLLPKKYIHMAEECYEYMLEHSAEKINPNIGFLNIEIGKMKNLLLWIKNADFSGMQKENLELSFLDFFTEHDRRRTTDYKKIFPELADHFNRL